MAKPPQQEIDGRNIAGQVAGAMGAVPNQEYRLGNPEEEKVLGFKRWLYNMGINYDSLSPDQRMSYWQQYLASKSSQPRGV